ncbi:MAG: toxin-antitoxin system HicB family antitoxin [Planctomycetes bacterium]|nr:toxin-antitoxin system HicB family antitoxin [Planctomycetota bacterium]
MTERKPFLLRLPPDLHDELRAWAEHDLRSLNAQIEYLLREAVQRRKGDRAAKSRAPRTGRPRGEARPGP